MKTTSLLILIGLIALLSPACDSSEIVDSGTTADAAIEPESQADATPPDAAPPDADRSYCTAAVVVGFFLDEACTEGSEVATITFDTSQECYGWTRMTSEGGTRDNSATRFQCFQGLLCYTQHPGVYTCEDGSQTDKQSKSGECLKEPAGSLYSRILSGTDDCPEIPDGFECPISEGGVGTPGMVAHCE